VIQSNLIYLPGGQKSFAVTERLLSECCGWTISNERIRQACQAESPRVAGFRAESQNPLAHPHVGCLAQRAAGAV
jgi:hypothetical protein